MQHNKRGSGPHQLLKERHMKDRNYWIARIEQHLVDLAMERCPEQRERIMRRICFASRRSEQ